MGPICYSITLRLIMLYYMIRQFKKEKKQNRIETAIAPIYIRYESHLYIYKVNNKQ